jgi:hypothetical protein
MPRCVCLYDEPDLILDTARARVGHHHFEERCGAFVGALSGCEDRHHPVIGDYHVAERVASDDAAFMTGSALVIDGGITAQ